MIARNVLERLLELAPIASKDATRPHIGIVRMIVKEVPGQTFPHIHMTATDGRMLMTRELRDSSCPLGSYQLKLSDVAGVKLVLKEFKHPEIECTIDADGALLLGTYTRTRIGKLAFDYPNIDAIMPAAKQPNAIAFDFEYLATLGKALTQNGKKHIVRIEFDAANPLEPFRIVLDGDTDSLGVLMPCQDSKIKDLASILRDKLAKAAQS